MERTERTLQFSFVGVLVFMFLVYLGSIFAFLVAKFLFPLVGLTFPVGISPVKVEIACVSVVVQAFSVLAIPFMAMFNEKLKSRILNELILIGLAVYTISTVISSYLILHLTFTY